MEYQSAEVDKIFPAVVALQSEINNPKKSKQGHGYKYAELSQIIELSREPLANNGLAVTQYCATVDGQSHLVTQMIHSSGQWIRGFYPLEKAGMRAVNDAQQMGAAMTYARRYNLAAMLGVAQEDDDAASVPAQRKQQQIQPLQQPLPVKQQQQLQKVAVDVLEGQTLNAVTQWLSEGMMAQHVIEKLQTKYALHPSVVQAITKLSEGK
ncbi:MAG: ERF family protein [Plesiomonas sp.]